jgi:hypothetical protein
VRLCLLAALAAIMLTPAHAQMDTSLSTSVNIGISGALDTRTGGAINTSVGLGKAKDEPPRDVMRYVKSLRRFAGGALSVGETVPGSAVRGILGNTDWGYAIVNGLPVIVDRNTNAVTAPVR